VSEGDGRFIGDGRSIGEDDGQLVSEGGNDGESREFLIKQKQVELKAIRKDPKLHVSGNKERLVDQFLGVVDEPSC